MHWRFYLHTLIGWVRLAPCFYLVQNQQSPAPYLLPHHIRAKCSYLYLPRSCPVITNVPITTVTSATIAESGVWTQTGMCVVFWTNHLLLSQERHIQTIELFLLKYTFIKEKFLTPYILQKLYEAFILIDLGDRSHLTLCKLTVYAEIEL